jgi:hypothetical protein
VDKGYEPLIDAKTRKGEEDMAERMIGGHNRVVNGGDGN